LLAYDSVGALWNVVGARGQQPGEFGSIDKVVVSAGDSVFVLDNTRRRIVVLDPALAFARSIPMLSRVTDFLLLRDGRIVVVRSVAAELDPLTLLTAGGELIRSFGAARLPDGSPCLDCGDATIVLAPSGYRLWLAWSRRYQLEEWDLTGRRTAVLINPARTFGDASGAGIGRLFFSGDGSLWLGHTTVDSLAGAVHVTDVLDPVRARLVRSLVGMNLRDVVFEGIRAAHRVDENGFAEIRLERYQLDRRR
jgi:hypothetical protein